MQSARSGWPGARVANHATNMGLTELQIRIEQGQWLQLAGALNASAWTTTTGVGSAADEQLATSWPAVMRKHAPARRKAGATPTSPPTWKPPSTLAVLAVAGDPEPVDAEVVEPEAVAPTEPDPPLTVPPEWTQGGDPPRA